MHNSCRVWTANNQRRSHHNTSNVEAAPQGVGRGQGKEKRSGQRSGVQLTSRRGSRRGSRSRARGEGGKPEQATSDLWLPTTYCHGYRYPQTGCCWCSSAHCTFHVPRATWHEAWSEASEANTAAGKWQVAGGKCWELATPAVNVRR